MAKKKSFILYADLISVVELLPKDKAGELFLLILKHVNGKETEVNDLLLKIAFGPIKNQLQRDLESWEDTCNKRSKAGKAGGLKSGESRSKPKQNEANEADTVNDTVTDYDTVTVNEKENESDNDNVILQPSLSSFSFNQFWDLYNKKIGLSKCENIWQQLTEAEKALIKVRLPAYIIATKDEVTFRKDPATWLSGKHWLDEHVPIAKKKQYRSAFERLAETGSYE